jgi:hypothetical protein
MIYTVGLSAYGRVVTHATMWSVHSKGWERVSCRPGYVVARSVSTDGATDVGTLGGYRRRATDLTGEVEATETVQRLGYRTVDGVDVLATRIGRPVGYGRARPLP